MSTYCHAMQDLLDTHKTSMPDAVYQELVETVGDESQRGLKLVTYSLAKYRGDMMIETFTMICRPATNKFCLAQLLKCGEYDPAWLEAESPVTDVIDRMAYTLISIKDLAPMPKRRRTAE